MKIKISPNQLQKQILAPSMQQSIEVLLLPVSEMETAIDEELQNNPLLDIADQKKSTDDVNIDEIIQRGMHYNSENNYLPNYDFDSNDDDFEAKQISRTTPLEDYLLQQLRIEITDSLQLKVGELIIGNLNEDGYFNSTCEEIAQLTGTKDIQLIEQVLNTIQNFEPLGIAARSLSECLQIQIHYRFNGNAALLSKIVNDHLDALARKQFAQIAKILNISAFEVKQASKLIASLEPKPARNHRPVNSNVYIKADATIQLDKELNCYKAVINNETFPQLRINTFYQELLKDPNRPRDEVDFIKDKIKNAINFIRSIEQRNSTLQAITQYIAEHQKDFFDNGHLSLKPMNLKDVAVVISRNESTVCRAVSNKYIDTPQGLLAMKYFFSQGVAQSDDEAISNRSIKEEIKLIIEDENKSTPLSDHEIQKYFQSKGMEVARRTIGKYRQLMKILPSHLRKV